jgi:hypothetical protein
VLSKLQVQDNTIAEINNIHHTEKMVIVSLILLARFMFWHDSFLSEYFSCSTTRSTEAYDDQQFSPPRHDRAKSATVPVVQLLRPQRCDGYQQFKPTRSIETLVISSSVRRGTTEPSATADSCSTTRSTEARRLLAIQPIKTRQTALHKVPQTVKEPVGN